MPRGAQIVQPPAAHMDAVNEAFETFLLARDAYERAGDAARDAAHANDVDRGVGRLGLPADVLATVLGYSDLREVAACAAASSELKRGLASLPPGFERSLVIRRFPILSVVEDAQAESTTTPRDLFRLFCEQPSRAHISPTTTLRDYGFLLEIELRDKAVTEFYSTQFNQCMSRESLFLGTGLLREGEPSVIEFRPPRSVFARVSALARDSEGNFIKFRPHVHFRVMATRRGVQGLQLARLHCGPARLNKHTDSFGFQMDSRALGHYDGSEAAKSRCWFEEELYEYNAQHTPTVQLDWYHPVSSALSTTARLSFHWYHPDGDDVNQWHIPMDDISACNALEHYANWV